MNAIVSGLAGVALLLEEASAASLRVGAGNVATPCQPEDFHLLFGDAGDLQFLEDVDISEVVERLASESTKELSLQLALVFLDSSFSRRTRLSAAEELEGLFRQEVVTDFVNNVFYARPLPEGTVSSETLECIPKGVERFRLFIETLWRNQTHIADIHKAWTIIPLRYFHNEEERSRFQAALVRSGVFRELVTLAAQGHVVEPSHIDRWERSLADTHEVHGLRPIIGEWLTILDGKGDRTLGAPSIIHDTERRSQSTVQHIAEPAIEREIRKQYERVWMSRLQVGIGSEESNTLNRELRKLRKLQVTEAREMSRRWESNVSLSRKRWSEALATAEKVLHA